MIPACLRRLAGAAISVAAVAACADASAAVECLPMIGNMEIHCYLTAADGAKQALAVSSYLPSEVDYQVTQWIGTCGKVEPQSSLTNEFIRAETTVHVPVTFPHAGQCAEVRFAQCRALRPEGTPGAGTFEAFACPEALKVSGGAK
jgi:hypothetical protein